MRVDIDKSKCQGHALCAMASGDYFELDDLGYIATDSGDVTGGAENAAHDGAEACPEKVITIHA
ncbi:ferredoxin [Mycolicibacterium flavescens]|uniref:Ferredoxin n=1 Tax=Mycolicibacterium flavescens TaxID=1776 RepID=A0A1E3RHK6_MYCFV|nr:ferredoxin [Mycolicibacterium flavescens]MCV7280257.1 ferredoxin [Mycolicibacterium flavescens]ODQ89344.1 ferredoxin [Mycolicibacterium flavescens]